VPALRTEVTEITTGLAMFGYRTLDEALEVRPASISNVTDEHFDRLLAARGSGQLARAFEVAWQNGVAFARAPEGLRGRPPWWLEWKGGQRPPGYEQIPADLRVDHVYLVSCKYGSDILTNSSPANLFDRRLSDRKDDRSDWFLEVAPEQYQAFYASCREALGTTRLPAHVGDLEPPHRAMLKRSLPRRLTGDLAAVYEMFAATAAATSASRWMSGLKTMRLREEMLWRLLRLQSAPYFVLGESAGGRPLRYRVGTPWDFRTRYRLVDMEATADQDRSQPVVCWVARVRDVQTGSDLDVAGHVEVRWSHGRFAQVPEAKVYLDTGHHAVPGYVPLDVDGIGQLALRTDVET
jgi:hypothetical protein